VVPVDHAVDGIDAGQRDCPGNESVLSQVPADDATAVVYRTIDQYAAQRLPFRWCVGPLTQPADFGGTLERLGFVGWPTRGMGIDPTAWKRVDHEGISIEIVTEVNLPAYYACWARGWEAQAPDVSVWIADHVRALATGRFHFYLARVDGAPAGTAGFITKPNSGYLVGGNVLPEFRKRGVYRALLDERLQAIRALGLPLAVTHAREATSAPILEALGFESLYRSHMYRWEP
jgi:GNAT superfamily N-acetyltransferase